MEKHYLGLEYCKPHEAGLASEARAVGNRLGELLDGLSAVNNFLIEPGELTDKLWRFKVELIDELTADGWVITVPKNNYKVKPPRVKRQGGIR